MTSTDTVEGTTNPTAALLTAAWMAVLLGVVMQLLTLAVVPMPSMKQLSTDVLQKVSWSTIVCVGLAIGTTIAKSKPGLTGLAGLISAPAAFLVAKTLQKSLAQAIGLAGSGAGAGDVLFLTVAKAIEYGVFGLIIGTLQRRDIARLRWFVATGLVLGAWMAVTLTLRTPAPSRAAAAARVINETIFPIGCSLVLFVTHQLGKRLAKAG